MITLHFRRAIIFGILGVAVALLYTFFAKKVYEARLELLVGEQERVGPVSFTEDVMKILQRGVPRDAVTERQILSSESVFYDALKRVSERVGDASIMDDFEEYYQMYDVLSSRRDVSTQNIGNIGILQVKAYSPRIARELANAIVDVYSDFRKKYTREAVNDAIEYLQSQIKIANQTLEKIDKEYQAFKEKAAVADFSTKATQISQNVLQLTQHIQETQALLSATEAELAAEKQKYGNMSETIQQSSIISKNPLIQQAETQLADLKRRKAELLATYTEDALPIRAIDEAIARVQKDLEELAPKRWEETQRGINLDPLKQTFRQNIANAEVQRDGLRTRLAVLQAQLANKQAELMQLPAVEVKLTQLLRQREVADLQFRRLTAQLEDLRNRAETVARSTFVLSVAKVKDRPVAPDEVKLGILGFLAGVCLGVIYSLAIEAMRLRVYSSAQLEQLTGLKVVASIPVLPGNQLWRLLKSIKKRGTRPLESFRYMAASLLNTDFTTPYLVMFTNTRTAQRSAISAAQFALSMASYGKKTLLVDFDFSRFVVTTAFELVGRTGTSDLLNQNLLPGEGASPIVATEHENLYVLPIGLSSERGLLYSQAQILTVIESLRSEAEVIVLAMPPCDVSSDPATVASTVDKTCLIVSATRSPSKDIVMAYNILTQAGARDISLILVDASRAEEPFIRSVLPASPKAQNATSAA